ncbi:MAG: tRNA 2-thiocytidine biosynthesis protein TtcA [Spirochaetales bacterium]|nr:tRNA 2-thiocytidine biosynthesis protein TtcA [Spirochaetales bacterium]
MLSMEQFRPVTREAKAAAAKIAKRCVRGVQTYGMISPGDRIILALSGGKDSMSLAYALSTMQKSLGYDFYVKAVHIQPDFDGCTKDRRMDAIVQDWGIEVETLQVPIKGRLKPGRSLNCYWCSTQRRTELLRYAAENDFSKIALGHHMDDILETLLMNMAYKGEISTMLPMVKYDKYPQYVIRPLCLVKEHEIVAFAREMGLSSVASTCPYGQTSNRLEARRAIDLLAAKGDYVKENLFAAMSNVNTRYMPEQE